ncbi:hypothetical protein XHV734_0676 [Xanthomonas hortorum pv. vitians]|nr:hypothetical protein XHV734_0676 [Xanthomonas hortorum pv. vitians]
MGGGYQSGAADIVGRDSARWAQHLRDGLDLRAGGKLPGAATDAGLVGAREPLNNAPQISDTTPMLRSDPCN